MKKKTVFAAMGAMLFTIASCDRSSLVVESPGEETATGEILVSVTPEENLVTKAVAAYTDSQTYESKVNTLQIFVFDSEGKINIYKSLTSKTSETVSTTQGQKTVWAVVNGSDLSDVKTVSELKAKAVDLSGNSTTESSGFIMSGSNTCTVGTTQVSCSITVKRLAARVALRSVKNDLPASYGSLTINRVFLDNVVGNQNIEGTASPATWYNKEGRADDDTRVSSHIIDGSTYKASCPSLTFKSVGQSIDNGGSYSPSTPDLFYCYANGSTTAPDGFSETFSAQRTVLVIDAT